MKIFLLISLFLLTFNISALGILENIPEGTKIVAKLDFAKLKESPLYAKFQEQNKSKTDFFFALFAMMSGISTDEINNVWLIARENRNGVLIMEGNFDVERIKQLFSTNNSEIVEKNNAIFAVMIPDLSGRDEKNLAVIIDEKTVAVGRPDRVDDFLAVKDGRFAAISSEKINSLKKDFSEKFVFKMILLELPQELIENQILKNIVSCDLSVDSNDCLDFKFRFFMIDEEITKATEHIINGVLVYLRRIDLPQEQNHNEYTKIFKEEIISTLKIKSEKTILEIDAKITEQTLNRLIELKSKMNIGGGRQNNAPPCQIETEENEENKEQE